MMRLILNYYNYIITINSTFNHDEIDIELL